MYGQTKGRKNKGNEEQKEGTLIGRKRKEMECKEK